MFDGDETRNSTKDLGWTLLFDLSKLTDVGLNVLVKSIVS